MKWYTKIYLKIRQIPYLNYYTKLKLWLRETSTGRIIDRAWRMLLIGTTVYFLDQWTFGVNPMPLLQTAFMVTLVGTIDKVKNELLSQIRSDIPSGKRGFSKV